MCDNNQDVYFLDDFNWITLAISVTDITNEELPLECSCTLIGESSFYLQQTVTVSLPDLVDCNSSSGREYCINDLYIPCAYNEDCMRRRVYNYNQYDIYLDAKVQYWSLAIDDLPDNVTTRAVRATIKLEKENNGKFT